MLSLYTQSICINCSISTMVTWESTISAVKIKKNIFNTRYSGKGPHQSRGNVINFNFIMALLGLFLTLKQLKLYSYTVILKHHGYV